MKQIKNGYADYYYLLEDGSVYNAAADMLLKISKKHSYLLRTIDNERKRVSVRTLYKLVYNKPFCIDNITNLDNE